MRMMVRHSIVTCGVNQDIAPPTSGNGQMNAHLESMYIYVGRHAHAYMHTEVVFDLLKGHELYSQMTNVYTIIY